MKRKPVDTAGQRDLDALIKANLETIESLRDACSELIASAQPSVASAFSDFDDVALLRYVLSFGTVEYAMPALEAAVQFHTDNLKLLQPAGDGDLQDAPDYEAFSECMGKIIFDTAHCTKDKDNLVVIVPTGRSRARALMESLPVDKVANCFTFFNEYLYRFCDRFTRERRRLTKIITIHELTGFKFSNFDSRLGKSLGVSSHRSEFLHPQMVYKPVFLNPPRVFKTLFAIVRPLLSKSSVQKVGICMCTDDVDTRDIARCPFAGKIFQKEQMPVFLGGLSGSEAF